MIHERFFVEDMKTQEARFVGTSANHRHCITLVLLDTQNIAGLDGWVHCMILISTVQAFLYNMDIPKGGHALFIYIMQHLYLLNIQMQR